MIRTLDDLITFIVLIVIVAACFKLFLGYIINANKETISRTKFKKLIRNYVDNEEE